MEQYYKSYEQAALDILRGKKTEEPVEEPQEVQQATSEPKEDQVEEAVQNHELHVKPVKVNGQTKYKVHAVGSKFKDGIKVGEHLSDSELDDFSEMGGKVKHMKEDVDQEIVDDTLEIVIPEHLNFADYLLAAKKIAESEEEQISLANEFFNKQDESLVIEAFTRSDIEDKINAHSKAGHQVSLPKYSTKEGKPYAEYTVTNKDSGQKIKYIHHGSTRRVERQ